MTILIVANGDMPTAEWLRVQVDSADFIIAADGGTNHLHKIDRLPDLVVGDLDSVSAETLAWLEKGEVTVRQVAAEKDETDLELALLYATAHSEDAICICAAFGGRVDQEIANIMLLTHPNWLQREIRLIAPHQSAWVFTDSSEICGSIGDTLSLIPLAGDAIVANTMGLKWELQNSTLKFGPARGVSNILTAERANVKLTNGIVLCVSIKKRWQR